MLVRTQVLFEEEDLKEIKSMAYTRGVSMSEFLRTETRKKILKKKKKKSAVKAMLELAEWAKKNNITGPSDLGSNDEYLYGKLAADYPKFKK